MKSFMRLELNKCVYFEIIIYLLYLTIEFVISFRKIGDHWERAHLISENILIGILRNKIFDFFYQRSIVMLVIVGNLSVFMF